MAGPTDTPTQPAPAPPVCPSCGRLVTLGEDGVAMDCACGARAWPDEAATAKHLRVQLEKLRG